MVAEDAWKRLFVVAVDDVFGEVEGGVGFLEWAADVGLELGEGVVVGGEVEALGVGDDAVEVEDDAAAGHGTPARG